jgi:excisionase family DNA binding protein
MNRSRPNPRLIKIHRNYTVDEAARTLQTHKNTIRTWLKNGLPAIDNRRPTLIHGLDLRNFLEGRRRRAKQPCPPGHIYCVRCRAPRMPAGNMVEYVPITATSGNLRAICPDCETLIHRRTSIANLETLRADLETALPQDGERIDDPPQASVNCDSSVERVAHENA